MQLTQILIWTESRARLWSPHQYVRSYMETFNSFPMDRRRYSTSRCFYPLCSSAGSYHAACAAWRVAIQLGKPATGSECISVENLLGCNKDVEIQFEWCFSLTNHLLVLSQLAWNLSRGGAKNKVPGAIHGGTTKDRWVELSHAVEMWQTALLCPERSSFLWLKRHHESSESEPKQLRMDNQMR